MRGCYQWLLNVVSADYAGSNDVSWIASGQDAGARYFIHWDGTALTTTPITPGLTELGDNVCGRLGAAKVIDGRFWIACGQGEIATRSGPGTIRSVIAPVFGGLGFWGTSPDNLYLTTGASLRHWNGESWSSTNLRVEGLNGLAGTGEAGADELFGAHRTLDYSDGSGDYTVKYSLAHFDGTAWLPEVPIAESKLRTFNAQVYPLDHDEALIVGSQGTALHYRAGTASPIDSGTTDDLSSIWGPDPDHVWITSRGGRLFQWDRANPTSLTVDSTFPATTDELTRIAGAEGLIWVLVAHQGHVWMRSSFGTWTQVETYYAPTHIAAVSATNVLLKPADSGVLLRWNGTAFEVEYYPSIGLSQLYALPDGTAYLGGLGGIVRHLPL